MFSLKSILLLGVTLGLSRGIVLSTPAEPAPRYPNIVYILSDDLGYGDVHVLNPEGKIATPHLDRLAEQGMVFTAAHSSSAVCTPTRYGLLTGRYNWRSPLQHGVLGGLSPMLIEPGRLTVPELLKAHGYATACIGKWHLGLDWVILPGKEVTRLNIETPEQYHSVDYSQPVKRGPNDVGFDSFYGLSGSLDMIPYAYFEDRRLTALPTETRRFPAMTGRTAHWTNEGPTAPAFEAEDVLPHLTGRAVDYIRDHASAKRPFFLYLPLTAPHAPIVPSQAWLGKSGLNPYADFVMELDWSVGEILRAIDEAGIAQDTLVVFTSDNGVTPRSDISELVALGHHSSYEFRGRKAEIYEGGHRIPFIVRWPARVSAGTRSDALVCLNDLLATCAEIVGAKLPDDAGEDSVSVLPLLRGNSEAVIHEALVHHSLNGSFAITSGQWKLVLCADAGTSSPTVKITKGASLSPPRLFNLSGDMGESHDVAAEHPDIVTRLWELLDGYVRDGRSTPGPPQANDVPVEWRGDSRFPFIR